MSTDAPNTKQPLLPVTCDCKHIKDIVIPMERWSIHIGHEETNDLLARCKVGMNIDVRAHQHCGNCHECMEYRKWLAKTPLRKADQQPLNENLTPRDPISAALKLMWRHPEPPIYQYIDHSVQYLK